MPNIRKHITYIVHGARADRPELRQMVRWVRERGHAVDVRITWNAGDAEETDGGRKSVLRARRLAKNGWLFHDTS